jgi:hypothetical protein
MQDKISLLMEETGCDRGEAELALEMCGFQVEEAIKAIARLLKNIAVVKCKFAHPDGEQFGLLLLVANVKHGGLLRSRAVLSFNPAVYSANFDRDWFEFEKYLYGCRLWEGSVQAESLEIEQRLAQHYREAASAERLGQASPEELTEDIARLLSGRFKAPVTKIQLRREILDLRQFQTVRSDAERAGKVRASTRPQADDLLVLKVALEQDPEGASVSELHAGDLVAAEIVDQRDIAQYLAKLFGGYSDRGPVPVLAPVEALESGSGGTLVRVRFSVGVCGDATVPPDHRVRVVRHAGVGGRDETTSWWKRFFKS